MKIYNGLEEKEEIMFEIECGAVFIYPTDTIYGIGCNATDSKAVRRIRKIKVSKKPFSVIVPGKKWIENNCVIETQHQKYLKKLPGKYTLILKLKNKDSIAREVSTKTIGVRIPKNEFSKLVEDLGFPVVTTSVNETGKKFLTNLKNLDKKIERQVDFAVDAGKINGKPSTIIDLTQKKPRILR